MESDGQSSGDGNENHGAGILVTWPRREGAGDGRRTAVRLVMLRVGVLGFIGK